MARRMLTISIFCFLQLLQHALAPRLRNFQARSAGAGIEGQRVSLQASQGAAEEAWLA